MKNVLVFSCGAVPAVDINYALRGNKEYRVFGASSYDDHGIYIYQNYIGNAPYMSDPYFLEKFNQLLVQYKIDFIIPLHEDMILFFQEHKDELKATTISSSYETALLCRYKSKTYAALSGCDFVPKTFQREEVDEYPVFVKKDNDQGSRHAYKVDNYNELLLYTEDQDMIICEYLPGEEVTVDCFTDRHGRLRFVNPRVADRMLAGIDVHARRIPLKEDIKIIAEEINQKIKFRGPWFFQIKKDKNGKYKLLEIATRFAGAFGLTRCMDINTPYLALQDFENKDIVVDYNDTPIEADKIFFGRYSVPLKYEKVVLDGEASLLIDDRVDTFLMMFLYQCVNKNKEIILVSDDTENSRKRLTAFRISEDLVTVVEKRTFDDYRDALFISRNDEARFEIRNNYGIMCYAPSTVEALLDWRG